jgi:hypothetical protein
MLGFIIILYIYIYLTAIGLTPGSSRTAHIYTQTIHRIEHTYQSQNWTCITIKIKYNNKKLIGKCGPCLVFANYTLAFALQLRKKHGKTSARVERTTQADIVQ